MNIPKFFIKHWQFTVCIFLLIAVWGVQSALRMPKSEDPLFALPQYSVVCIYPGASPLDIEQLVVKPLESALGSLSNIEFMKTDINSGIAVVIIKFLQTEDEKEKYDEVQREINKLQSKLPDGVNIEVIQASIDLVNILQYALVGDDVPYREMEETADRIKNSIERVKGVKEVKIHALPKQQITVNVNLNKMATLGVTLQSISHAVQSEALNIPGGYIDVSTNRYSIISSGDFNSEEAVRNIIVKSSGGKLVYLKDIADVQLDDERLNYFARYNDKKAIFITANQQEGSNIFTVTENIEKELKPFYKNDKGIHFEKIFDQSQSVSHRLDGLYRDFFIAILLVLLTLLPLGTRASYVVMFTIPTSILIGVAMLHLTGYSLNQFSIVGLIIALGLLVDDSIIVVENIVAKLRKGENKENAAIKGTNQLLLAIIAVTACILLSFLPLITLQGVVGDFIRSLPLAVVYTILGSLFVSLTLTPMISKWFLNEKMGDNVFYRGLMKLNEGVFIKILEKCLRYPKTTLFSALGLILVGVFLIKVVGTSLFPSAEKPEFFINVTLPMEKNVAATDSICQWVEKELKKYPQITKTTTNIGKGNPQVYYNLVQLQQYANIGQIFCEVDRYDKTHTPLLLDALRANFANYPHAKIEVKEWIQGPLIKSPIEIRIIGENQDTLKHLANQVADLMTHIPGTIYVDNPLKETKSEVKINVNHDKALELGVPVSEISKTIRMAFAGLTVGDFSDNSGKEYNYNIVLTLDEQMKTNFDIFNQIYVSSLSGRLIPLSQIASLQFQDAASVIQHYDKQRSVVISSSVISGYITSKVTQEIVKNVEKISFPDAYSFQVGGESEKQKESFGGLSTALTIALFAIIAVLILAFNGIKGTVIIASAIPLGLFGSIVALWLFGYTFSLTAFIGVITLIGLEVKNTIIIVDFTNQMRASGHDIDKAIEMANKERFTPIFLTTLTAVFALIPLVLEKSAFFTPLALVIIGGLISSLFLSLFVEAVLYKMMMK